MCELVSVIIPVYKVESYLERCVRSVIQQSYANMEIILVDDGSPDSCGDICDQLAKIDGRIKVYHKENGGLSDARNFGTEKSHGKYITFVDSDDYIAENYIEYLYDLLSLNHADIACCGMVKTEKDIAEYCVNESMPEIQLITGQEACKRLLGDLYMTLVTAWGKLYKSDIVRKYPFPKGRKHEDEATTCKFYYESTTVVVGNQCLYTYYQNPTSITHVQGERLNKDVIWALEHRAQFFEECHEFLLAQMAWTKYFYYCVVDSLKYDGRCDCYLMNFDKGKVLSKRLIFEYCLYKTSKVMFKVYFKSRNVMGKLKRKVFS